MKVLVGCEESQVVTGAFRELGHEAYSCDIIECRVNPDWHLKGDIKKIIASFSICFFDLIILHPDCTKMAVSGNRWYGRGSGREGERQEAIEWTQDLWELAKSRCDRVALENPVSVIFKHIGGAKYVQPWQFGHGETKKTGFALHNVNPLKPTNIVDGREQRVWKMGPSETRKRDRSETYSGVAQAMANQWA